MIAIDGGKAVNDIISKRIVIYNNCNENNNNNPDNKGKNNLKIIMLSFLSQLYCR